MLSDSQVRDAWRRSPTARVRPERLILVTDFDGTLADIVADPGRSAARPEALAALRRLARKLARVVVLSSRSPEELGSLVPVEGVQLVGDSGLPPPTEAEREALRRFNSEVPRLLEGAAGTWLEIKPASSSVHYRSSKLGTEEVLAVVRAVIAGTGLVASVGRRVVEVHAPDAGKGPAIERLLSGIAPGGVVCLGDDENDRSMFEHVSRLDIPHMCVGVSSAETQPDLFERCDLVVSGPGEVAVLLDWMAHWAEADLGA